MDTFLKIYSIQREKNFIIDVGFDIGTDRKTRQPTSSIYIDGFGSKEYHIYPRDPQGLGKNDTQFVIVDAWKIIDNYSYTHHF